MGFYKWLVDIGLIMEPPTPPPKPDKKPPRIEQREPTSDELSLGFEWTRDEDRNEVWRMKGVPQKDRLTHFYVIGASGAGKTKFLEHLIQQDVKHGFGFGIIDPHGDLIASTLEVLSFFTGIDDDALEERVILIDPTDKENTICFNPLELAEGYSPARQAKELVEAFRRIWGDSWGDRMADILRNSLIVLIENELTLNELLPFLTDADFRAKLLPRVKNETCRDYFRTEFNTLNPKTRGEWITSTSNKVRAFLADDDIRDIFLAAKSSFNFREAIDSGKILLVRIPKGILGDENTAILGSLILSKIQMAAFSRADTNYDGRVPFYLYIDEFQNFASENFAHIMDEARKYKLALTLAHQHLSQVPKELRSSLLNCPLQVYFRVSRADAEILAKEMFVGTNVEPLPWESYFQQLQTLSPQTCYVKNKNGGNVALLDVPPADWIETGYEQVIRNKTKISMIKEAKRLKATRAGGRYLRERRAVRKEYRERMGTLAANDEPKSFREQQNNAAYYAEMIRSGENDEVEFKASLRWLHEQKEEEKPMEYLIVKAVSAFMNTRGGTLFIGVRDDGGILGIEKDYETIRNPNKKDGFMLQLTRAINKYLGREFHQYAAIRIVSIQNKDVCAISVSKSERPVYLKDGDKDGFFIRATASSQSMRLKEANDYIQTRFTKHRI